MKMLYIHNVSGSQLEVATVSLVMEKNAISADCFPEDKLASSSEIQKFKNLKFIKLLTAEELDAVKAKAEAAKPAPEVVEISSDIVDKVIGTIEQPQAVQTAIRKMQDGLDQLKALLEGKTISAVVRTAAPSKVPVGETEAAAGGTMAKTAASAPTTPEANEDEGEFIPDIAPKGMEPKNDPVRKFFGKSPYTVSFSYQDKMKFITGCGDPGMLREIAIFETPGRVKDMAKKKLRESLASVAVA